MAEEPQVKLSMPESDIALVSIDVPGKRANVLSRGLIEELDRCFSDVLARTDLSGLIIASAKPGTFVAGADINEFTKAAQAPRSTMIEFCQRGRRLFQRLSECAFPTVAAIDGVALGGGAELALWCDRRVMTGEARTQYGFPEVKLGIIPGWGGTARTPRMIGLSNAVELVTSGEPIGPKAALPMGLADDVVPAARLVEAAVAVIRDENKSKRFLADRQKWAQPIPLSDTELTYLGATASAYIQRETKGQYPAPLVALEVMLGAARSDVETACQQEAEAFAGLFPSPESKALVNVFLMSDRNKRDPGIDAATVQARPVKSVGVVGAGLMGSGIAAAAVRRELPVTVHDSSPDCLARGLKNALEEVSFEKAVRGPSVERSLRFAPLFNPAVSLAEFAHCDLVIEAVVENPEVKTGLYAALEPLLRADAVLASNTSTIPIARLAAGRAHPERFCGIHFFNPVRKMPLVEVIRGPLTRDETVATAVAYVKAIGKSPIVVNDGPGFLVNRLLLPYMNEALDLVAEGAELNAVDRAAKGFGMPMGPITLYDVVGLDTALFAGRVMHQAFPDRCPVSPLLAAMVDAGRLGQKAGVGFFKYGGKKGRGEPDPSLAGVIGPFVKSKDKRERHSDKEISARLFLPMVLEATRVLEDKIVRDPRDVDLGLIYGIGFPPFKGGLLFWADTVGAAKLVDQLGPLAALGPRFSPTPMLLEMARTGRKFYE
jgi:3-hydroxyacyl-CoA dehydrogenase/enoyl-CoA hydratase/3-hydroxybutyryl-CoA epimerase/3-hydroxyacyl-CoA dehydrogenase/enoyl-CoA hydratase/3-hydroxybutyryl-CoA epimerase/enoyl-CoA isomerase